MPVASLAPLVQKFASAYLEMRWSWPRQFSPLSDFCFLLIDSRAGVLDVRELRKLSDELPEGDAHQRLSVLRRFAERLAHYKQRRIWPAVTNVRRRAELEAAVRLRIPFVTGPAVCAPLPNPAGGRAVALANLPLNPREECVPRPQVA